MTALQRFPMAHGSGGDWRTLCAACLQQLGPIPESAGLDFLYVTDVLAPQLAGILRLVQQTTGVPHWVGGIGAGISCTGREYYDTPAMALMLTDVPDTDFRIIPGLYQDIDPFVEDARRGYAVRTFRWQCSYVRVTGFFTPGRIQMWHPVVARPFPTGKHIEFFALP